MANPERLKLIQSVIDRMARNSFALKGWSATTIAAVIGLGDKDESPRFALIGLYAILAFLLLDAYYLALERKFRALYDRATIEGPDEWSLTPDPIGIGDFGTLFSPSVLVLYGLELTAIVVFALAT